VIVYHESPNSIGLKYFCPSMH